MYEKNGGPISFFINDFPYNVLNNNNAIDDSLTKDVEANKEDISLLISSVNSLIRKEKVNKRKRWISAGRKRR